MCTACASYNRSRVSIIHERLKREAMAPTRSTTRREITRRTDDDNASIDAAVVPSAILAIASSARSAIAKGGGYEQPSSWPEATDDRKICTTARLYICTCVTRKQVCDLSLRRRDDRSTCSRVIELLKNEPPHKQRNRGRERERDREKDKNIERRGASFSRITEGVHSRPRDNNFHVRCHNDRA